MKEPEVCWRCKEEPEWTLIDISVQVAQMEEGDSLQSRFFCEECTRGLTDYLIANGFGSHLHGGINWLEDTGCPGSSHSAVQGVCPAIQHFLDDDDDVLRQQEANGGIVPFDPNTPVCTCPPYGVTFQNLMACPLGIQYHIDNDLISNAIGLLREAREQHGAEIG